MRKERQCVWAHLPRYLPMKRRKDTEWQFEGVARSKNAFLYASKGGGGSGVNSKREGKRWEQGAPGEMNRTKNREEEREGKASRGKGKRR